MMKAKLTGWADNALRRSLLENPEIGRVVYLATAEDHNPEFE